MNKTLTKLIVEDLGAPTTTSGGREWWRCPFHDDKSPSMSVSYWPDGDKWTYKCWACDAQGDDVDWLVNYRRQDKREAMQAQRGEASPAAPRPAPKRAPSAGSGPPPKTWQDVALDYILDCAGNLYNGREHDTYNAIQADRQNAQTPPATRAAIYLQSRGILSETQDRYLLGYNPKWREVAPGQWLPPGITIPCSDYQGLWYVQVRLGAKESAKSGKKYQALGGSRLSALFNGDHLEDAKTAVICEGEFDALLLGEYMASDTAVVTMGSAGSLPTVRQAQRLAEAEQVYIATDDDPAGVKSLDKWRELLPFAQPLPTPNGAGKDITDWYLSGVNLAEVIA